MDDDTVGSDVILPVLLAVGFIYVVVILIAEIIK